MTRIARTLRRSAVARLTRRDEALLSALGRFRLARTSDLLTLFFAGIRRDTALARLRRLFDGGYITVVTAPIWGENVYGLGPRGFGWCERRNLAAARPPRSGRDHHLAIVAVWARLATILARQATTRLVAVRADWEIRGAGVKRHVPMIPDLLVEIARGPRRSRLVVEVDRATESLGVLTRKLEAYNRLGLGRTPVGLLLVVLGATERRARELEVRLRLVPGPAGVVRDLADLEPALLRLVDDVLPPLVISPSDKGTVTGANPQL